MESYRQTCQKEGNGSKIERLRKEVADLMCCRDVEFAKWLKLSTNWACRIEMNGFSVAKWAIGKGVVAYLSQKGKEQSHLYKSLNCDSEKLEGGQKQPFGEKSGSEREDGV